MMNKHQCFDNAHVSEKRRKPIVDPPEGLLSNERKDRAQGGATTQLSLLCHQHQTVFEERVFSPAKGSTVGVELPAPQTFSELP